MFLDILISKTTSYNKCMYVNRCKIDCIPLDKYLDLTVNIVYRYYMSVSK